MRAFLAASLAIAAACGASQTGSTAPSPPELVGELTRQRIEAEVPGWAEQIAASEVDTQAAQSLTTVEAGAEIDVYLGTWCPDSKREVTRLFRIQDLAGAELPFVIRFVGVDREKAEPALLLATVDLEYVPTFVVTRDGQEVGRIVESSPNGLEADLLALLRGEQTGVITARE